ncbi:putative KH and PIN-domain containing protein [uncultured archaeon]|nr:putative KH and PIN-domain containing protein [uncultured archaeon]
MAKSRFIADTSVIVDGRIIDKITDGTVSGALYISNASIEELEHQANEGKETGFTGFDVMKRLRAICEEKGIELSITGERPRPDQVRFAKEGGEIDALIRRMARELDAALLTGDKVQHLAAEAEGVETIYLRAKEGVSDLSFKKYFTPETMSIHLKESCAPLAKVGKPGEVRLISLGKPLSTNELRAMSEEIIEATKRNNEYYLESEKKGATVIQMGSFRIVITKPPFSDGFEITIVRPIKKLKFSDYEMSEKLRKRLEEKAEGIVICGPPGSGKSTFAAALAEFYQEKGKIVKTLESPRDLQVKNEITQYGPLEGDFENTKEVVLLVRPDYSFYDEVRVLKDFLIYADMRMTGVGMVGVVHANRAIDAIHRFISKIEMGMVPQIIDTVVLIQNGGIRKVYELGASVKVPYGMRERDLARPVIEIRDFETGANEYEIYKFGEETVIIPIKSGQGGRGGERERGSRSFGEKIESILRHYLDKFSVEENAEGITVYVQRREIVSLDRKSRKKLDHLVERYHLRVKET